MCDMKWRLDRRGFTLIELLAVIVILAVIIAITVPNMLDSLDGEKTKALWVSSKSVADGYASLGMDSEKLGNISLTSSWQCLGDIKNTSDSTSQYYNKTLLELMEIDDVRNLQLMGPVINDGEEPTSDRYCSAIRNNDGKVEVLLVAKNGTDSAVRDKAVTYAFSTDNNGKTK